MSTSLASATRTQTTSGWLFAILSTVAFSTVTPFGKSVITEGVPTTAIIVIRLWSATALLGLFLAFNNARRLRVSRRVLLVAAVVGVSNGVGMMAYFSSLSYISASIASMIFSLSPLVVLMMLALRGEKFTYRQTVRVVLGLFGVYLLIGPGGQVNLFGVLLAAVSIFTVPLQLVLIQWFLPDGDAQASSFYATAAMALTATMGWVLFGLPWQTPTLNGWVAIASITVLGTVLGRLWMFMAIQRIGGGQVGLLAPLETLLTVIWSLAFLSEWLTPLQWLGGAFILFSALLAIQRLGRVRLQKLKHD
jgi:drug/metabolite transporter (DMT)-like permease